MVQYMKKMRCRVSISSGGRIKPDGAGARRILQVAQKQNGAGWRQMAPDGNFGFMVKNDILSAARPFLLKVMVSV